MFRSPLPDRLGLLCVVFGGLLVDLGLLLYVLWLERWRMDRGVCVFELRLMLGMSLRT